MFVAYRGDRASWCLAHRWCVTVCAAAGQVSLQHVFTASQLCKTGNASFIPLSQHATATRERHVKATRVQMSPRVKHR